MSRDVEFVASHGGEELLLVHNIWFGWPDPPEWGLLSRPSPGTGNPWQHWGHFSALPEDWVIPGEADTPRLARR